MTDSVTGKVTRLFVPSSRHEPSEGLTRIRLDVQDPSPKDGYFQLDSQDSNYSALYSLVLAAAINRYDLRIDTQDEITSTEEAVIDYLVVNW
jgi:hypothetical protein